MVPPVERSGDNLNIADYNKVTFKNSNETHYGGDFNRKFFFSTLACLSSKIVLQYITVSFFKGREIIKI